MNVRFEVVTSAQRFDEVGPAWDLLWQKGGHNVF